MTQLVSPDTRPALGGLHAGWATFGDFMAAPAAAKAASGAGLAEQLRGLIRRLGQAHHHERDIRDMPAYLLADIGLDPRDARPQPLLTESSDAAMWVGIKTGMLPRI